MWITLLNEFKSTYLNFNTKKDVIIFQKKMQKNYKITLSNCDLVKLYENLNIDNIKIKNLIIKKKTKIKFWCIGYYCIDICTPRIY